MCLVWGENVKAIKVMLRSFESVSGLKINFAKSRFGAIGKSYQRVQNAANYLNCRLFIVPFLYLGIPIGENPRSNETDTIVQRCERKLSKWKQRYLSFGVRVTLIKSVLTQFLSFSSLFSGSRRRWSRDS